MPSPTVMRVILSGGALGVFTPPDQSNLVGWWDANAITNLSNNDPVTQWNDKSGFDNHVTQGTGSAQPTYKTNQQYGLPAVSFDGGDHLELDSIASYFTGEDKTGTGIVVIKDSTGGSTDVYPFTLGRAGTNTPVFFFAAYKHTAPEGLYLFRRDDGSTGYTTNIAQAFNGVAHINSSVYRATTASGYFNGAVLHDNVAQDFGTITLDSFALGAWKANGVISHMTGLICEVLLWRTALSDVDRILTEQYLAEKWGITRA